MNTETSSVIIALGKVSREQELERLVTDACYLLSLQAEEELSPEEYERWCNRWLKEAGIALWRVDLPATIL
jgi:hypothetical protein